MKVALFGAGGKMGSRISNNMRKTEYDMLYVENAAQGLERLGDLALPVTSLEDATRQADILIMAVPDVVIGEVASKVVPLMKTGAMMLLLDPAAAYHGDLPARPDISYFIAHPCHPPIFNDETTLEARRDYFGGIAAKQAVVCSLMQGSEADYARGEQIATSMYAPILRTHRISVEQMAMLEPTMAETIGAATAMFLRSVLDYTISKGVPAEAARDFMLGHLNIELAIAFGEASNPFSDACLVAIEYGKKYWLKEGWEQLFEPESVYEQIDMMLHPDKLAQTMQT